jgi:LPXTG-site transpeptidase (sortase) family protein
MRVLPLLLLLLQGGLLLGGGGVAARPAYRWGVRQVSRLRARTEWQRHCHAGVPSDRSGRPALWLRIPSCDIDDLVLSDDTTANLARHACLVRGAPPVILGHRDTHFRRLRRIAVNDPLAVQQRDGTERRYRVTEIEILPVDRANRRLHEHRDPECMVLMTCHPFNAIGPAPNRMLVWVRPV